MPEQMVGRCGVRAGQTGLGSCRLAGLEVTDNPGELLTEYLVVREQPNIDADAGYGN